MEKRKVVSGMLCAMLIVPTMALCASAETLPIVTGSATDIVIGDLNGNQINDCMDIVQMKKHLIGQGNLSEQQFRNADLNLDGKVNVIDLCLLKTNVLEEAPVKKQTWQIDQLPYTATFWTKATSDAPSAVITTTAELEAYLAPISEPDVVTAYLAKYDEAFFAENVLLLNTIAQSCGEDILYTIDGIHSMQSKSSVLFVSYSDHYEQKAYPDVVSALLAQVTIPKTQYYAHSVIWINESAIEDAEWIYYDSPSGDETILIKQHSFLLAGYVDIYQVNADGTETLVHNAYTDDGYQPFSENGDWSLDENGNAVFSNGTSYSITWTDTAATVGFDNGTGTHYWEYYDIPLSQ